MTPTVLPAARGARRLGPRAPLFPFAILFSLAAEAETAQARGKIPVLEQITRNTTGNVFEPRLRMQGAARLAFLSNGDVKGPGTATTEPELYLYEVASGGTRRATTTPGYGVSDAARPTDDIFSGNREEVVAFVSSADLDPTVGNADHNPEIFVWEVFSGAIHQVTDTLPPVVNRQPFPSDSGKCIAFVSNGDLDDNDGTDSANNPPTGHSNGDGSFEVFLYNTLDDEELPTNAVITQVSNAPSTLYESSNPVVGGYWFGRQCQTTAYVSTWGQTDSAAPDGSRIFTFDRNSATTEELLAQEIPWGIVGGGDYLFPSISSASQFARGPFIVFQTDADLWRNGSEGFEVFRYRVFHPRMTQYTDVLIGNVERPAISDGGGNIAFQSDGELLHPGEDANGHLPPFNADGNREIFLMEGRRRISQITDSADCDNSAPSLNDDGTAIAFRSTCDHTGLNPAGVAQIFLYRRVDRDDLLAGSGCRIVDGCCNEANGCYRRLAGEKPKTRKKDCVNRPRRGCAEPLN